MIEIFKDIPGYEGMYQVSNLGNVKSLKYNKERVLKQCTDSNGYYHVTLCGLINKKIKIHKLVAMVFLGHKPCGYEIVVDHINNIVTDNRVENLQLISNRENCSKDKIGFTSKFIGVFLRNGSDKWISSIKIKGKTKHLGRFNTEIEASKAYQNELKKLI